MEENVQVAKAELDNGVIVHVEATNLGGEQLVSSNIPQPFEQVTAIIEGVTDSVMGTLQKVKPHKATVQFSVGIALDSGTLTAILVKGSASANLTITLEWGESTD